MSYINPVSGIIDQLVKRDSLGRRIHPNQGKGRPKSALYYKQINIRVDKEMFDRIKRDKITSEQLRSYIEWGLENDK